jgi:hypothetical protein
MRKKLIPISIIILLITLSIATVIALAKTDLVRFEMKNRTDQPVSMSLLSGDTFYYLTVAPDSTKVFTVERLVYDQTTWACGNSSSGKVDIQTFLHLTFTKCEGKAPNKGERGLEKVHLDDAPYGVVNRFTYTNVK